MFLDGFPLARYMATACDELRELQVPCQRRVKADPLAVLFDAGPLGSGNSMKFQPFPQHLVRSRGS